MTSNNGTSAPSNSGAEPSVLSAGQIRALTDDVQAASYFSSEGPQQSKKYLKILHSMAPDDQSVVFSLSRNEQLNFAKKVESGRK
jgi:hypothetical protein